MALAEQRAGSFWRLVISAGAILLINMGARSSLGLFVGPLDAAKGFGLASIGFAFGVSQFVWGAAQPVFAVLADVAVVAVLATFPAVVICASLESAMAAVLEMSAFTMLVTVPESTRE